MREKVRATLQDLLKEVCPEEAGTSFSLAPPPTGISGDLSSNAAMLVSRKMKVSPRVLAERLARSIEGKGIVGKADVAGPGFLNVFIKEDWILSEFREILRARELYAQRPPENREKMLIEFVSANPTGPLHVGHGRGAALGDSLSRIFKHLGHEAVTEYYVNDVGNQMQNLGLSVMKQCQEDPLYLRPSEQALVAAKNPADLYKGDYILHLARALREKHPDASARPEGVDFFREYALNEILNVIRKDLEHFQVFFDGWYRESDLYKKQAVEAALSRLKDGGYLKEEDGALWFLSTRLGDDKDRVIKRKDERPTYFASDIAYHDDKFRRGFVRLVNIWGTDHHGYVSRLKGAVKALGYEPDRLVILLYQLVTLVRDGKPVSMSTRSGEFVTLTEVVDEVGRDAARFFFALRSPDSHLEFDLELAKRQAPENPVFYVQYVHARCCSLFREAEKRGIQAADVTDFTVPARLSEPERDLLMKLISYPDTLEMCVEDLSPHHLTAYLLGLASEFHRFYEKCRVLSDDAAEARFRLAIVDGTRTIIRNALQLLGVSSPDKM
ncbi:MAG TPA: arginine--tRNA ligase [Elusimicrobiota bacterium]|nr:arginine--tRNA ligase [Elusimicrobiota bacterium]